LEFLTLEERRSQGEAEFREEQNDAELLIINGIEIIVAKLPEWQHRMRLGQVI
jgi:hypothetical protein